MDSWGALSVEVTATTFGIKDAAGHGQLRTVVSKSLCRVLHTTTSTLIFLISIVLNNTK